MSRDETKVDLEEGFFIFKEDSLLDSNLEATRTHASCHQRQTFGVFSLQTLLLRETDAGKAHPQQYLKPSFMTRGGFKNQTM